MIRYFITAYYETENTGYIECTINDSLEQWQAETKDFVEKYPSWKYVLLNAFPIPDEIYEMLDDEDGVNGRISLNF